MSLLDRGIVGRIRRNHGLEHGTVHILSATHPHTSMVGRSDSGGFWIYGDVSTEDVEAAVEQALARMQHGESGLAIHPFCGTNIMAAGLLSLSLPLLTAGRAQGRQRVARAGGGFLAALMLAPAFGTYLQRHVTTSPDESNRIIKRITRQEMPRVIAHRVEVGE